MIGRQGPQSGHFGNRGGSKRIIESYKLLKNVIFDDLIFHNLKVETARNALPAHASRAVTATYCLLLQMFTSVFVACTPFGPGVILQRRNSETTLCTPLKVLAKTIFYDLQQSI